MKIKKGDAMLLFAAMIGGIGFINLKVLLDSGYTPYQVIFGRFLVAVVCMSLFCGKKYKSITKEEWKVGSILGVLLAVMFLLMVVGLQYTTPSVNAFLCNTPAVIVPFILWFAFRQKPAKSCFLAAFMTLVGVALLSLTKDFSIDLGAALSLAAAVAFSFQMAFLGNLAKNCDSIHIALVENAVVLVLSVLIVTVTGWEMPRPDGAVLGNFFFLGAFCTALYFALQSVGQKYTSPSKTAIIITSESIFAAIASAVFYGERMSARGYVGCVLIFLAMLLAERPVRGK